MTNGITKIIPSAEDYEGLIDLISGVITSKINFDEIGQVAECHVLADNSRNVKQIVRDIQSALMAQFRQDIDYKKISVAQIDVGGGTDNKEGEHPTIRIKSQELNIAYRGSESMTASVTLICGEGSYTGTATTRHVALMRGQAIAEATVDAIQKITGSRSLITIAEVKETIIYKQRAILAAVLFSYGSQSETLLGSALVRADENQATVNAVLDALNRRLNVYMSLAQ
ncbi:MAG: hypothetical protein GX549_08995 [Clostridiales bacterium]|nr:hypothetical protein [Clostridiales bacterium]